MRADPEIIARIKEIEGGDFFGFVRSDLVSYLGFDEARPFLKDGATPDQWAPQDKSRQSIIAAIADYMPFAWDKANDCRGLSAGRSINHMQAWLWMLGVAPHEVDDLSDYTHYGKPQLRAICEALGLNWRKWDDDQWGNGEDGPFVAAHEVRTIKITIPATDEGA
jgi:hypothetical protein